MYRGNTNTHTQVLMYTYTSREIHTALLHCSLTFWAQCHLRLHTVKEIFTQQQCIWKLKGKYGGV